VQSDTSSEASPPRGAEIRTFLFADLRGYTRFTQEHGDEAASAIAARFADIVRDAVPEFEGDLLELRGDEALCVFSSVRQALRAAVELQRGFRTRVAGEPALPVGVGMGLDAGEAVPTEGGYRGSALNRAARLCSEAKAGEILATETVIELASRVDGLRFGPRRLIRVKGFADPIRIARLIPEIALPPLPAQPGADRASWQLVAAGLVVAAVVLAAVGLIMRGGSTSALDVSEDSLVEVSAAGHLGSTALLRESPFGVAITGRVAWLPLYAHNQVLKVDTQTGQGQVIQVGPGPDALAAGHGAVWVANAGNGTLSEVNSTAGQAVGSPIYVGNGPSGVAVGSSVWVTLSVDGAIAQIDPTRGTVLHTFSVGTDPTKVAIGYHMVWVTNESVGTVTPINPHHDEALSPIPVGNGPNGIAVGDGGVWVTNSLDGTMSKIDPNTLRVSETLPAGRDPEGVSIVGKDVWVAARGSDQILRFDSGSGARLSPLHLDAPPQDIAAEGPRALVTTANAPASHRGGTLTVAMGSHLHDSIDPQSNESWAVQPWEMLSMTNDGLVAFKRVPGPDGETVVADLARALPIVANDDRTYTFQLRKGITYSTGQPVRLEDIRHAIERTFTDNGTRTPTQGSLGGLFFDDIVGAKACEAHFKLCNLSTGIKVDDATASITFRLTRPDPDFLAKLAMPIGDAVPAQVAGTDTRTEPVPATGPYMISAYNPRSGAVLVRNPHFHEWSQDAQPDGYPNRIIWRVYRPGADVTAVERGAADWLSNEGPPEASRAHELETTYAAQLHVSLFPSTEMLGIGSGPLLTDPLARRAISYAIDRARIVSDLGGALQAQPTCQLLPPNFPGYRPYCPFTIQPHNGVWTAPNTSLANRLIRRAKSAGATVTIQPGTPNTRYVVHLFSQLGYKARPAPPTNGPPNWQVGIFSFIADYPGAADFINYFPNPLSQRDITATYAKQTASQYQGTIAWAAADRRIADYAQVIGLATDKTIGFTAKRLGNYIYSPAPGNDPLIDQMWVK